MKKSSIYKALSISNDLNAIRKGRAGRRIMRKYAGRKSGSIFNKLIK